MDRTNTCISAIEGNTQWLDGGAMFGNVPRPVWETWVSVDARGRVPLACRCLLIEHAGHRILCETGIGAFFEPKLAERYGVEQRDHVLLKSLAALGLSDRDIDVVILSHLHFDHAGGLLPAYDEAPADAAALLFPKARYVVGKEALARALAPHLRDRASFVPGLAQRLQDSGRLLLVDGAQHPDLWPGRLAFRISNGHTPGQMHTIFRGERQTVVFCGDLIPGSPWVHLPVTMGYDRNPELLIDEKLALYNEAVPEHWLLFFTHDVKTAAAQIQQDRQGRYSIAQPLSTITRLAI